MLIFASLIGLLIALAVGAYIFLPYFWEEQTLPGGATSGDEMREKLMTDLANLEYDFRSGKLDEASYQQLRVSLEARLLEVGGTESKPSQIQYEETQHD